MRAVWAVAGLSGAIALAALGGFAVGAWRADGAAAPTRIEIGACGIAPGPPAMALDLDRILHATAPVSVALGPVVLPGVADPVTIRFDPVPSESPLLPRRDGAVISLPIPLSEAGQLQGLTLRCRYGAPAMVRYDFGTERLDVAIETVAPAEPPAS